MDNKYQISLVFKYAKSFNFKLDWDNLTTVPDLTLIELVEDHLNSPYNLKNIKEAFPKLKHIESLFMHAVLNGPGQEKEDFVKSNK